MRILWSEQAVRRLEEIQDFIATDSPAAANALIAQLLERAESLKQHPEIGRYVPEVHSRELRELLEGNYRIVYRVSNAAVEFVTVFEGHRMLRPGELSKK